MIDEKAWKFCEAGHTKHETEIVSTIIGNMHAYKTDLYMGFDGYCSGQDDISKTLKLYGVWEPIESAIVKDILERGDKSLCVIDIGAHTGWYSIMAAKAGYQVISIEADPNNIELLRRNAKLNDVSSSIAIREMWIDKDTNTQELPNCELIIIDIEGNDDYAVEYCRDLFLDRTVKNAMIEISPTFNDRYPAMVDFITSCGYSAWYADQSQREFDNDYSAPQFNLLFTRSDGNE